MRDHAALRTLAVLLFTTACATSRSPTAAPQPVVVGSTANAEDRVREAIAAHARLQTAIDTKNPDSMMVVLDPDIIAVTFQGDTLRGAGSVAAHLLEQTRDPAASLVLYRGRMETCLEGWVLEYDGKFSAPPAPGSTSGSTVGFYATSWAQWAGGERVSRIVMVTGRSRAPVRMLPCRLEYMTRALDRRVTAVLSGEFSPVGSRPALSDILAGMVAQGYNFTDPDDGIIEDGKLVVGRVANPTAEKSFGGAMLAVRYRVAPSLSTELRAGVRRSEIVRGLNNDSARMVTVKTAPMTLAQVMRIHRRNVTVGVGPAMILSNYTVIEDHQELYFFAGAYYWTKYGDRVTKKSLAVAPGVTADITGLMPMSRRTLMEWRVAASAYARTKTPPTPYFSSIQTANSQVSLSVGLTRGWR
jgi:hypothetical protein